MWFVWWDPCGLACYAFGWATILFVNFVLMTEIVWPWLGGTWHGIAHVVCFQFLIGLICSAYLRAACTDPGTVPQHTATSADMFPAKDDPYVLWKPKRRYCAKCECLKPPRAHHCSTCGRCVNKMDHHCPWVNNCVGSNNIKFFLQFLLFVFVGGVYTTIMAVGRLIYCWRSPAECPDPSVYTVVMGIVAVILGIFFAIFTSAIFWDQYEGLVTNTTGIESMKRWQEEDRSLKEGLHDACGERCGLRWFGPFTMPPHAPSFYAYSPSDDPDAYDPRDPLVATHFNKVGAFLRSQEKARAANLQHPPAGGGDHGADATGLTEEESARLWAIYNEHLAAQKRGVYIDAVTAAAAADVALASSQGSGGIAWGDAEEEEDEDDEEEVAAAEGGASISGGPSLVPPPGYNRATGFASDAHNHLRRGGEDHDAVDEEDEADTRAADAAAACDHAAAVASALGGPGDDDDTPIQSGVSCKRPVVAPAPAAAASPRGAAAQPAATATAQHAHGHGAKGKGKRKGGR